MTQEEVVDYLSGLTVLDIADLVKKLETAGAKVEMK